MTDKNKLSKTREMLVKEYIKSLEQEKLPWIKEWGSKSPHNAITQGKGKEWVAKKGEKSVPCESYYYYNKKSKCMASCWEMIKEFGIMKKIKGEVL